MMIGLATRDVFNIDTQRCRCFKKPITCRAQILVMCASALGANSGPRVHLKESLPPQSSYRLLQLLISHSSNFNPLPIINFLNFICAKKAFTTFQNLYRSQVLLGQYPQNTSPLLRSELCLSTAFAIQSILWCLAIKCRQGSKPNKSNC